VISGNRAEDIKAGEFEFKVTEGDQVAAYGKTLDGGIIKFDEIKYTQDDIGIHTYVLSEGSGDDKTLNYTEETVTVTVQVSDAGGGKLKTTVTYPEGGAKFVNAYSASGSAELSAVAELTGGRDTAIGENEFTFTVTENGKEVANGATLAGGEVKFDELNYTQDDIGTHTYVISEDKGSDESIEYAKDPVTITVKVSDAGSGKLNTEVTCPEDGAKFINKYVARGSVELTAVKELTGGRAEAVKAGEFTFEVTEDGQKVADGATLDGGEIKFDKISYTQADLGVHTYLISEVAGEDVSISYEAEPITVKVTVTDAGGGKLNTSAEYPEGGAKFVNRYLANGTIELAAMKELTGNRAEAVKAGEFTFTATENGQVAATGETLEGGAVKFTEIKYTQADIGTTHTYEIREDIPEDDKKDETITYTSEPVTVTVAVSDAGSGKLKVEATYPEGGAKFVNAYQASGKIELTATKELTGSRAEAIGEDEFTFTVTENDV
jgi:pilin isopeptide linkage protein